MQFASRVTYTESAVVQVGAPRAIERVAPALAVVAQACSASAPLNQLVTRSRSSTPSPVRVHRVESLNSAPSGSWRADWSAVSRAKRSRARSRLGTHGPGASASAGAGLSPEPPPGPLGVVPGESEVP